MARVIETQDLTKTYQAGEIEIPALQGINFQLDSGEFVAIMGASGSGKSTLMNILGCLDYPTSGDYYLDGVKINNLNRNALADIRNHKIGFVFQGFNLLSRTTALENVALPLLYDRGKQVPDYRHRARESLEAVGLTDRMHHVPSQLSGGQQQRVAIARALVMKPSLILADEPTGNLDSHTSHEVMQVLKELNGRGVTIVLVTHEKDIAAFAGRVVEMRDGRIVHEWTN